MPHRPRHFGNEHVVNQWDVLGNTDCGNCVFAGAAHEHMLFCGVTGTPTRFNTEDVVGAYSTVTGYKIGDDSTDQGTVVRDALKYRVDTGLKDNENKFHK